MQVRNIAQLEKELMKEINETMGVVSEKIYKKMCDEVGNKSSHTGFYNSEEPKIYERTGALGNTPSITDINKNNNEISFSAYLDQSHRYQTGDKPTMGELLDYMELGIRGAIPERHILGRTGFWERSLDSFQNILDEELKKKFK